MTTSSGAVSLGYLLPTREKVMAGKPEGRPLLRLAAFAEAHGFDSVWAGDSLIARPRHEPLTLLAGVAGCTERVQIGTAVLLPALRNPVLLAQQLATLDQISEGRLIVGAGIAGADPRTQAEFNTAGVPFEKRVGRMLEGFRLCRALWSGEPVDWDGRWQMSQGVLGPMPHRAGGPPIWLGGGVSASRERAARHFDGWFPTGPAPEGYAEHLNEMRGFVSAAGRAQADVTAAVYATIAIDDDAAHGEQRIDAYLDEYYGVPAKVIRKRQACFSGSIDAVMDWLDGFVKAGAQHVMLRLVGDHEAMIEQIAKHRAQRAW